MEFRVGTCSSCQAKYKVPATFTGDKAKCKKCGGVVAIGAVQKGAPAAKAQAPKPVPARVPAKAPSKAPAKAPVKAPARTQARAQQRPKAAAAAAGVAAATRAKAQPRVEGVRKRADATAARVQAAGTKKPAGAAAGEGTRRSGAGRSSTRSGSRRSGRRAPPPKKKMGPGVIVGIVVILAGLGAGGFFLFGKGGDETNAAETDTNLASVAGTEQPVESPDDGAATGDEPDAPTADEEAAAAAAKAEEEAAAAAAAAKAAKEAVPAEVVLLDLIAELPELEPLPGTDPEAAAEMKQWMADYVDPYAGAAGARAGKRLQEQGKQAFPFILNGFRKLEFQSEDGFRAGDLTQKLLTRICNGNNLDWKYPPHPGEPLEKKDLLFNQKVVKVWFKLWDEAKDDDAKWAVLTKTAAKEDEKKPAKAKLDDF